MANTTSKSTFIPDVEAATERAVQANERYLEAGRKLTNAYLDGVERYIGGLTQFERKLGEQARVDVVNDLLHAHAEMTEDLTKAGVKATRELIVH